MSWPTRWTHTFRTRRLSGSRTRRLLELHLAVMVVTALVSMSLLLVSYREVQNAAGEMRTRGAPAVQGVAATQLALLRAQQEAQDSVDADIDTVIGAGAGYEIQLAAANQGLSRLSDVQIDGTRGRGVIETVNGLLTSYSSSMTPGAVKYVNDEPMQKEKFDEAQRILIRKETGVVPRLGVLQKHQMQRVGRVSHLGALQRTGWAVAELCLLVLVLSTLSALWVLRSRCGRSSDPWLLLSLVAAVALAVLPLCATAATQGQLDAARGELDRIEQLTDAPWVLEKDQDSRHLAGAQRKVNAVDLRGGLAAGSLQSWTYYGALGCGALIVLLPAVGICRRLNTDYWRAG